MDSEDFWKIGETQINNCIISCSYIVILDSSLLRKFTKLTLGTRLFHYVHLYAH